MKGYREKKVRERQEEEGRRVYMSEIPISYKDGGIWDIVSILCINV